MRAALDEGKWLCERAEPAYLAPCYRWALVLDSLKAFDRKHPGAGRHPRSAEWEAHYGQPLPGDTCARQLGTVQRWYDAAQRNHGVVHAVAFGARVPAAIETAIGAHTTDDDWDQRLADALPGLPLARRLPPLQPQPAGNLTMSPGELDTPDSNGDETRAASNDTPRRAEHRQAGDGGQNRASRAPAETLTREDYGDRLREHGPPVPADSEPATDSPATGHETQAPDSDRRHPQDGAEPRDRESYAGDLRADTHSPLSDSQPAGTQSGPPRPTTPALRPWKPGQPKPRSRDDYTDAIRAGPAGHDSPVAPTTPQSDDTGETTAAVEPGHEITAPGTSAAADQQQPAGHPGPAPAERDPGLDSGHETGSDGHQDGRAAAGDGHPVSHYHGEFKGQALDLYTDGTRWAPGDRPGGQNIAGEKPDRSPGDTSDLPPSGEQLLALDNDKASRAERMRREGYRQADGVLGIASKWTDVGHDLLTRQPPAGYAEVSTRPRNVRCAP
jgi:hypothetical protein